MNDASPKIDGEASKVEITSKVPQGSVLGPIFFLIYINNMAEYTKHSSVKLFADDTIIYTSPITAENNCKKLQEDHQALERRPDKCSAIRITRKKTIHRYPYTLHEASIKYVGVTIADNMMWNTHIEQTAQRETRLHSGEIQTCAHIFD